MIVVPGAVAIAVGILVWPIGSAGVLLAAAAFLASQLVGLTLSHRRLEVARRRVEVSRLRRQRLRRQRRV
jgi:hypothetical protein